MFIGPTEPGATGGRGARRQTLRARHRLPADWRKAEIGKERRSPGWSTGCCAPADRPHRQHAPRRVLDRQAVFARRADGTPGLVEFRAFEMPPHLPHERAADGAAAGAGRALLAEAVPQRHAGPWGNRCNDRWRLLPHFVAATSATSLVRPARAGYPFEPAWFGPFVEFRFPRYGTATYDGVTKELRQASSPARAGEEESAAARRAYVDSVGRAHAGEGDRHDWAAATRSPRNGRRRSRHGRARRVRRGRALSRGDPPSALHPTIGVQAPLVLRPRRTRGRNGRSAAARTTSRIRRTQPRQSFGQRQGGGGAPRRAFLGARAYGADAHLSSELPNPATPAA